MSNDHVYYKYQKRGRTPPSMTMSNEDRADKKNQLWIHTSQYSLGIDHVQQRTVREIHKLLC